MKRLNRTFPLLALLVLVASLSGAAQTDTSVADAIGEDGVNLRVLLFINEVGLDQEQMETISASLHGVLDGRDELRTSLEANSSAFEAEMLAFAGTSEELAAAIEAYRAEVVRLTEAYEASISALIDTLGDTLTYAQGEVFFSAIPQLAPDGFFTSNREQDDVTTMRSRMMQISPSRRTVVARTRGPVNLALLEEIVNVLDLKLEAIS